MPTTSLESLLRLFLNGELSVPIETAYFFPIVLLEFQVPWQFVARQLTLEEW